MDLGCSTGNLVSKASNFVSFASGVDFSPKMINIAKKKYKKKNIFFEDTDILKYKTRTKFDLISANGFIEYFSKKQLVNIIKKISSLLNYNGYFIFSSRNRIFNIFSNNEYTKMEVNLKTVNSIIRESLSLTNLPLNTYLKKKSIKFETIKHKTPICVKGVYLINQYTPLQLVNFLKLLNFKVINLSPINYHSVLPNSIKNKKINFFNHKLIKENPNNLKLIPFSSSFMVTAKKL